jgi:hypothetical protein
MQASCEINVEVTLLDEDLLLLLGIFRRELLWVFCRLNGALDATIESCRPQANCTEAIEAIIRHLEKRFIFVGLVVYGRVWFSSRTYIVAFDQGTRFREIDDRLYLGCVTSEQ